MLPFAGVGGSARTRVIEGGKDAKEGENTPQSQIRAALAEEDEMERLLTRKREQAERLEQERTQLAKDLEQLNESKRRKTDDRMKAEAEFTRQQELIRKAKADAEAAVNNLVPAKNGTATPLPMDTGNGSVDSEV